MPLVGIHRDPAYFPDPLKFDPERFSDENKHNIHPLAFMPFGLGPRNCIGESTAAAFLCQNCSRAFFSVQVRPVGEQGADVPFAVQVRYRTHWEDADTFAVGQEDVQFNARKWILAWIEAKKRYGLRENRVRRFVRRTLLVIFLQGLNLKNKCALLR